MMDECENQAAGERERFEKWWIETGTYIVGANRKEEFWCGCIARQQEIDALKVELAETLMKYAGTLDAVATLKAENEKLRKDAERLDFIENSHLEISDREEGFVVNRITGYPNDREWHQLGEGETIREALDAAMTAPDKLA